VSPPDATVKSLLSADGTWIAFEQSGQGPPLILVEPAGRYRGFSAFDGLVPLLSSAFTVIVYDRRGRGQSTDVRPYSPDREIEDLETLIAYAGGSAFVYGYSSGALLALRAASRGVPIARLAVLEPPLREDEDTADQLAAELKTLIDAGRASDAVEHFHQRIGVPTEVLAEMRATQAWTLMTGVAHTLVYDCTIAEATTSEVLRQVPVRTLVLDSEGSSDNLTGWAARVAARLPDASHTSLAGEWHVVADDILAHVLIEFFNESPA
jgi:pimeloyl-ACP methyl ester carboxylesterase